jgi:Tfp pilus assembly protein PilZ
VELDMVLRSGDDYVTVQVVNLSRGGVFLSSDKLFPVGTELTLFVANAYGSGESLFEAEGKVVWVSEYGIRESELPRGMGVSFLGDQQEIIHQLDSFVVETLEMRLSGVDANALAPDFVSREDLDL